jgi:DNA-binding Lrp family transcriptional regulator
MPKEITDIEEFVRLSEMALACRVKRLEDVVKLKLRTPSLLYTIKLEAPQAEEVLKRIKCEVQEV